ncbi:MAG: hypothetical protein JO316_22765 [Abitibacteriaceae bacterium]|nr:hypothetical protein [Abditibacteriaceae bacterium]
MRLGIELNETDLFVLNTLFQEDLKGTYNQHYATQSILDDCITSGCSKEKASDSILCLVDLGFLDGMFTFNRSNLPNSVQLTTQGTDEACRRFISNFDEVLERVGTQLLSLEDSQNAAVKQIADGIQQPFLVVHNGLRFFAALGWVKLGREGSEYAYVTYVSPLLKRAMNQD